MSHPTIDQLAEIAANMALEARTHINSRDHWRQTFLSRARQLESGSDRISETAADDDVEAVAARIVAAGNAARGGEW